MEGGVSLLDSIYEEEDNMFDDVEMLDVEEGELAEVSGEKVTGGGGKDEVASNSDGNLKKKNRKRKKKRKSNRNAPKFTDVNRFVMDICRHLREKKSYMVYTAVGCLGMGALSDLVKEVDAIQACGGQMTADGRRYRNAGGVLWSIIKTREPKAYKEIMTKAKEFEKQFRPQNYRGVSNQNKEASQNISQASDGQVTTNNADYSNHMPKIACNPPDHVNAERKPVHERIRLPVGYDDLLVDDPKDDLLVDDPKDDLLADDPKDD